MKQIYTILMATVLLLSSCKKEETSTGPEDTLKTVPILTTTEITYITATTAKSGGEVTNDGGALVTSRGVCWSTTESPVVNGNKTMDGDSIGVFKSIISGLTGTTKYYIRAYATNSIGTAYGNQYSFTTTEDTGGTLDYNGYTYHTVTIGTQEWTVENLRTKTYNDGSEILKVMNSPAWSIVTTSAYCAYNYDEPNALIYGYLYNWYAINTGRLAPTTGGWRVATEADWTKLTDFIGSDAGIKLKAKSGWANSGNGTDDFGFSALPSGYCGVNGYFGSIGISGSWWSSTENDANYAWGRNMGYEKSFVYRFNDNKKFGLSVRLVRDK